MAEYEAWAVQVGANLQTLRKRVSLTQVELAGLVGMSQGFISDIEQGRRTMNLSTAVKLCRVLKCQLADVFADVDINL